MIDYADKENVWKYETIGSTTYNPQTDQIKSERKDAILQRINETAEFEELEKLRDDYDRAV